MQNSTSAASLILLAHLPGAAASPRFPSLPGLPPEMFFRGLAALGLVLVLVGLWAAWRLFRPVRLVAPATTPMPAAMVPVFPARPVASPAFATRLPDPTPGSASLVYLVARHDKVIQSPIAGVYITLGKCFQDLGFQVARAPALAELETLLKNGVPAVMGVDCRLGPRVLRDITRLTRRYPALRDSVYLFYNAERPETLLSPVTLPHAHFLGLGIASQQVMEILAPAFDFESEGVESGGRGSGAIFEGTVSENSLPEILQFLEVGRRTGLLSIEDGYPAGVINFEDGGITSAQTHLHEGMEAIFEILSLGTGLFRFFPGRASGRVSTRWSATEVLMHWAQRQDETGEMVARQGLGRLPD
ncbi:MAG TPA: DUF4388 domain-containing protein [Fibrobacteria bacterium]|nr:DUF4388 domain-containing protein [Fibrobacteria bacterium]